MSEGAKGGTERGLPATEPARFRELVEQVERLEHAVESLLNRTNTLVHLLDILNKRVDRLESEK